MKSKQFKNTLSPRLMTAIGAAALAGSASAQDLTGTYGSFSEAALQSAALDVFGEGFEEETFASQAFEYFSFGVDVRAEYNDNIFLTDADEEEDFIFRVSVPLEIANSRDAENQWNLSYTPKFNFYADNSDQDGIDHFVDAGYRHVFAKTTVDLGLGYEKTDGADRFASGSIEKDAYRANLSVSHQYSGKSRFDLDLGFLADDFVSDTLFDRERYNARLSWQYQVTGKLQLGPYVAYEHVDIDSAANPNQDAISFGVRGNYQALQKTTLIGYIGAEYREFDGDGLNDKTSPTFEFGAQHQLTGKVSLTGLLYHNIRASYSDAGQSYTATGINFLARYAATARINVRTGVSYEHDNYFGTSSAATGDLDSDYVTLFLGGDYVTDLGLTFGSGVRYSINDSETSNRNFNNFIFNVDARYAF
jgi:hypothetical protein